MGHATPSWCVSEAEGSHLPDIAGVGLVQALPARCPAASRCQAQAQRAQDNPHMLCYGSYALQQRPQTRHRLAAESRSRDSYTCCSACNGARRRRLSLKASTQGFHPEQTLRSAKVNVSQ